MHRKMRSLEKEEEGSVHRKGEFCASTRLALCIDRDRDRGDRGGEGGVGGGGHTRTYEVVGEGHQPSGRVLRVRSVGVDEHAGVVEKTGVENEKMRK